MRADIGTSLLWAGTWAIVGTILALAMPRETPWGLPQVSEVLWTALSCSVAGALGGGLFAVLLVSSKRRHVDDFSVPHVALQGAVAGVLLPAVLIALRGHGILWALPMLAPYSLMGATWAVATFAIAKRATEDARTIEAATVARVT